MTIGLVLDDTLDKPDGVQQAMLLIGSQLSKRGHEVHYIVMDTKRTDIENVHSMGSFWQIKFNGNSVRTPRPVSSAKIKKLFKDVDFDVLHVQMPYSPFFASKVLKYAPNHIKKIGTFHILPYGKLSKFGTKILGLMLKKSLKSLDKIYAVSKPSNEFMKSTFGVSGEVLPNPVDYKFFNSFKKIKSDKINIVFVGRFDERKGVVELVRTYGELQNEIRDKTRLTMCGKGPLLEEVKNYSDKHKLDIKFPGFVSENEKAQYLSNAEVAVFPSKAGESFGIVLTESMSAGAGVTIGGNNPGYTSVLGKWQTTLFDPSSIEEFRQILEVMISDTDIRNKIGIDQHEEAKKYDVEKIIDKLEKDYQL